ncbi:hypothetical protein TL16_g10209 [Triparma laevis f. inornata]|uniref:Uncharacterized protein n=2 Tax=Triparma laevis TaxID=1534972 RepID=A0A9W7E818_9STRA|nr:hypothetical protein TrLO_g12457 [Triparma laevis f. longispina]GMH85371.1 hypothetical protein TL16_g10209 [Triparma laevis f. inornata]
MASFDKPPKHPPTSFSDLNDPIGKPKLTDQSNPSSKVIAGAAAVGATVGMLVSGPAVALVAGAGVGIATMTSGTTGNVARSAGQLGVSVGGKAQELDKKHHIVDKTKAAGSTVISKAKKVDEKHHIVDKTKAAATKTMNAAVDFNKKHNITGKTANALSTGMDAITKRLSKSSPPSGEGKTFEGDFKK